MVDATATALVQDDSAPISQPEAAPTGEVDLKSELDAIWDRSQPVDDGEEEPQEAIEKIAGDEKDTGGAENKPADSDESDPDEDMPEGAEKEPDATEKKTEAPSELPAAIKKNWDAIPEEARNAFLESQREANRKLGEQGRLMQGISPIRDALADAVKELPALNDMRPQDVAREVMQLAKISNDFSTRPTETILGLIKQHGLEQAISQHFSGQGVTQDAQSFAAMQQELNRVNKQLARVSDPEYMSSQFDAFSTQQRAQSTVQEFAASQPDWADVEPYMPQAIHFVKASTADQLSERDTLERAYNLALGQIKPDAIKAESEAAARKAAPVVDPERSRKAQHAKSANIPDRGKSKAKPLTERELMEQIWNKNQS